MMPAMMGDDRLVPPMRYSEYLTVPSGNVWVSPIRYPVLGSAKAAISGTARPLRPCAVKTRPGPTPTWEGGPAEMLLAPPPPPPCPGPGGGLDPGVAAPHAGGRAT